MGSTEEQLFPVDYVAPVDIASPPSLRQRRPQESVPGSGKQLTLEKQPEMKKKSLSLWQSWLGDLQQIWSENELESSQGQSASSRATAWRSFQQQRLRMSVDSEQIFLRFLFCCVSFSFGLRWFTEPEETLSAMLNFGFFGTTAAMLAYCQYRLKACEKGSRAEWRICIAHQSIFVIAGWIVSLLALSSVDLVVTHRMFLMRYICLMGCMVHCVYLPQPWHTAFVTFPGVCTWIFFHWSVGFLKPAGWAWGFFYPVMELFGFHFSEMREWNLCRVLEHEKNARLLGESLKEAMRGMLNVVFDASCECDESGNVITSSQHLQNLIGMSSNEMTGLDLIQLAANPSEKKRITEFLSQSAPAETAGSRKSAIEEIKPPSLMETRLSRRAEFATGTTDFRVKLCCIALPKAEPDSSEAERERTPVVRRLFVGLQEVGSTDGAIFSSGSHSNVDADPPMSPKQVHNNSSSETGSDHLDKHRTKHHGTRSKPPNPASFSSSSSGGNIGQASSQLTRSRLAAAVAVPQDFRDDKMQLKDFRDDFDDDEHSLTASWTGTNLTAERYERFESNLSSTHERQSCYTTTCSSCTQTDAKEMVLMQSVSCQTEDKTKSSSHGCPPLPGSPELPSQAASSSSAAKGNRHSFIRQKRPTRKPFLPSWSGTPQHTIEFMLQEHVLMKINPCAKGCCFWHAGYTLLATIVHEMRLRKCNPCIPANSCWRCDSCGCLNDDRDEGDGDEVECSVCGEYQPDEAHHSDEQEPTKWEDLDSNFADESKEGSETREIYESEEAQDESD